MIKKLTNKKIVLISATVIVVVLILGFTLALWSSNFTQTGTNTIASDCFNIEYSESDATSLINSYPQTDEDGLKNVSYDVTIANTCNTVTNYSVVLNELSTNTLSESHVKVAVNDSYKMLNTYESATPSADVDNASSARLLTLGVLGPEQERIISIKSWMDENTTELEGENKTFGYKITIEASTTANDLLASKVLSTNKYNSVVPTTTAFLNGEPTGRAEISGVTYKEVQANYTTSISMTTSKYIGDGYTFSKTTGFYRLTDYKLYSEGSDLTDKYTCNSTSYSNCRAMYKVISYADENITESTKYTQIGSISGSGLFSASDADGTSYYLRGEINNNYVSFANKIWRVVRINGDGSIRMILDSYVGRKSFNTYQTYDKKYSGYTFDNNKVCTTSSPCDGTEGTSSTIKTYLDNWYTNNLLSYDTQLAAELYCNDTTYTENNGVYTYAPSNRWNNGIPTLECPNTTLNYGGTYRLKIGLPSADEIILAGFGKNGSSITSYLFKYDWFWTGSPNNSSFLSGIIDAGEGRFAGTYVHDTYPAVRPVINLVSDAKVASGNGTESTPYVIDMN